MRGVVGSHVCRPRASFASCRPRLRSLTHPRRLRKHLVGLLGSSVRGVHKRQDNRTNIPKRDVDGSDQTVQISTLKPLHQPNIPNTMSRSNLRKPPNHEHGVAEVCSRLGAMDGSARAWLTRNSYRTSCVAELGARFQVLCDCGPTTLFCAVFVRHTAEVNPPTQRACKPASVLHAKLRISSI